ncbi:hypothetical protein H7F50_11340 [Novosphingobium flavum]|nr:hypothetical protein [Novosphingobium aerophilum]
MHQRPLMRQREALSETWRIFPTNPQAPIHLRAIWPKGVPGERLTKNITFNARDYPTVADRQAAFEGKALQLNALGYNIYLCLNSVDPSFPGDERNGLAVKDEHIRCRRYLLIDIDRTETNEPISDDEVDDVLAVVDRVETDLRAMYGYEPLTVFSGNGGHIYIPLENIPNTPESKALCQSILRALAEKYDTPTVKIDTSVYNAGRITKVPGTVARKGLETEERPYRMAHVVE